jgi:hypothetical protein
MSAKEETITKITQIFCCLFDSLIKLSPETSGHRRVLLIGNVALPVRV